MPRREPRCHCGTARLELTATPLTGGAAGPSPALIALIVAGLCLALFLWRTGRDPARQPAPRGAAPATPRPPTFPPLPALPPLSE